MSLGRIVHLIDDDEAVLDSLAALLETHGFTVEAYPSAQAFLTACPTSAAGCLLTDIRMPEMDGLALQERVVSTYPRLSVIVMTGHADVPLAVRAMKAGAIDFIEKPFPAAAIVEAIERALTESARQRDPTPEPSGEIRERLGSLTPREREVLDGLVAGLPNKTIAYDLGISPRTVEIHRARVMEKMRAKSLSELVRLAIALGIGTSA
jgi:two-component system, LuxR family, response regulator FixJ